MLSRCSKYLWSALALVAVFYLVRHVFTLILVEGPRADLDILMQAARRFVGGESMYRISDAFEHTKPPLLMGMLFPLAWLPHLGVRLIWDLVVFAMPALVLRESLLLSKGGQSDRVGWRSLALVWALGMLSPWEWSEKYAA
jgi:hypothetical protein